MPFAFKKGGKRSRIDSSQSTHSLRWNGFTRQTAALRKMGVPCSDTK